MTEDDGEKSIQFQITNDIGSTSSVCAKTSRSNAAALSEAMHRWPCASNPVSQHMRQPLQSTKAAQKAHHDLMIATTERTGGRTLSHNTRYLNQEISSLLCVSCEKILYKLQKIFGQM